MKVSDITSIKSKNIRDKYINDNFKVKDYIPYAEKIVIARQIVDGASHDKDGHIRFNSPMAYLFYVMKILETWTNIEIDGDHLLDEYDTLNELGLINVLIGKIPESEKNEFDVIYDMVRDDLRDNELSVKHIFEEALVNLGNGFGEFIEPVLEQLAKVEVAQ